ncbi:hypothetical protein PHYC_01795 [Phycisphaerales bacterium]|nr:hypothetical protein PHYC_01795 [Phycisphaerales bacterium]
MERWEYTSWRVNVAGFFGPSFDPAEIDRVLNQAGAEGWELASVTDLNWNQGGSKFLLYTFKRPRAAPRSDAR